MCKRGFSECYNEYDVYDAIEYAMCSKCPKQTTCGISVEDDEEGEDSCIHIEQMVTCIYNHFKEREFE